MIASEFSNYGTQNTDDLGGTYYNDFSTLNYLSPFSVGYVSPEVMPNHLKPSYYQARYSPTIEADVLAQLVNPNLYYDIMYLSYYNTRNSDYFFNYFSCLNDVGGDYYVATKYNSGNYGLWGVFKPLNALKPSLLQFRISFTGLVNGTQVNYTDVFAADYNVADFRSLLNKETTVTFTHEGKTIDIIADFESTGYLWRDDTTIGFYWIRYQFAGFGRNARDGNLTGDYSYLIPAFGCDTNLTKPDILTYERDTKWTVNGYNGTAFHGVGRRTNWGYGMRNRASAYTDLTSVRWYISEGDTDNYLTLFDFYPETGYGAATQLIQSVNANLSGFFGKYPLLASSTRLASTYTPETLRYYHDHMTSDQCSLFVTEGRDDFANFVVLPKPIDIWHHMSLIPVWAMPTHENEIANFSANFWFSEMDDNQFKGNLIQGDDATLYDKVPTWILLNDTTISRYNPDTDRPSPTPEDDGDDDTRRRNDGTDLPSFDGIRLVSGTGFSTFYSLSSYHVNALSTYLSQMPASFWEALGTATDYKMANILDFIAGFKWYPLNLQASAPSLYPDVVTNTIQFGFNGATTVTLGDVGTSYKLGTVNRVFDFGTISIPYKDDVQTFLDAEPYTDVFANLPFIGMTHLHANQVLGYQISCHYVIDLITGMCTCFLDNGFDTIYTGCGKIGVDITVFGNDIITQSERLTAGYMGTATHAISTGLSIGASAGASDIVGVVGGVTSAVSGLVADTVQIANAQRGVPQSVGGGSGFGSTYCDPYPCIIVNRPAVKIPAGYGHQSGYVLNTRVTLGSLSGFTICDNPDLSGVTATAAEKAMIAELLQTGVYL